MKKTMKPRHMAYRTIASA